MGLLKWILAFVLWLIGILVIPALIISILSWPCIVGLQTLDKILSVDPYKVIATLTGMYLLVLSLAVYGIYMHFTERLISRFLKLPYPHSSLGIKTFGQAIQRSPDVRKRLLIGNILLVMWACVSIVLKPVAVLEMIKTGSQDMLYMFHSVMYYVGSCFLTIGVVLYVSAALRKAEQASAS